MLSEWYFIQNINVSNDLIVFGDNITLLTHCGSLNNGPLKVSMSSSLKPVSMLLP